MRRRGFLLALVAGITWGVISIFIRRLNALGLDAMDVTALRCILTAAVLLLLSLFRSRHGLSALWTGPGAPLRLTWGEAWTVAGCGIGSIVLFDCFYFATMQYSTVNIAVVLLYTSPVFVTLLSCLFFKEAFTWRKLAALVMVTLGCVFVSGVIGQGERLTPLIMTLGLCSGFFYALYSIFGRFARDRGLCSFKITLWAFLFAGAASLFMLKWGRVLPLLGKPVAWFTLAGLIAVSTITPYYTYTASLNYLPTSTASIVVAIEPVVGTLVGLLLFREPLSLTAFAGMLLVVAALFLG